MSAAGGQHDASRQLSSTHRTGHPSCSNPISAAAVAEMWLAVRAIEGTSFELATISGWIVLACTVRRNQPRLIRAVRKWVCGTHDEWMPNRWKRRLISRLTVTRSGPLTIMCTEATILDSDKDQTCKSSDSSTRISLGQSRHDGKRHRSPCTLMTPGTAAIEDLNLSSGTDEGTPWSRMNEADLTAQAKECQQDEVADRFVNKSYPGEGHSRRLSRVRCGSGWKAATTQHEVEGKLLTDDRDDETDSGIRVHLPFIVCQPNEQSRSDDSDVSELCGSTSTE